MHSLLMNFNHFNPPHRKAESNDSLKYVAPREPKKGGSKPKPTPVYVNDLFHYIAKFPTLDLLLTDDNLFYCLCSFLFPSNDCCYPNHLRFICFSNSTPTQEPTSSSEPAPAQTSKVLASAAIRLYQLNPQTNGYDAVSGGNPLGCVIVGMGLAYQILVYDGQVGVFH